MVMVRGRSHLPWLPLRVDEHHKPILPCIRHRNHLQRKTKTSTSEAILLNDIVPGHGNSFVLSSWHGCGRSARACLSVSAVGKTTTAMLSLCHAVSPVACFSSFSIASTLRVHASRVFTDPGCCLRRAYIFDVRTHRPKVSQSCLHEASLVRTLQKPCVPAQIVD